MHKIVKPIVTLVGAGPGDPDLLTIKEQKHAEANVVLYDALNEELLSYALSVP
jgi:uroporphyrin-III C-methyltransferase